MSKVLHNILETIGMTPVVRLNKVADDCPAKLLAKLEMFNPSGSSKARAAYGMLLEAEKEGIIKPGMVIVEPTSGNQGIALAMVGAVKGYRIIIVMPDSMSMERRMLARAYGAEVVLSPASENLEGTVRKAQEIVASTPNSWMPNQFANPSNPRYHARTTAQEILEQIEGPIDALVAGVGTGGTLTGIARVLKEVYPSIKVYAVEPANSAVIAGEQPGQHKLQGIGDGFVPENLDMDILDAPLSVSDGDAYMMTRRLAREEGILAGISSGAAVYAAKQIGHRLGEDKKILIILPDTGERYLSTDLYKEE
ncbi:cysteine synthase A [Desulfofarcimen acetoxidans DSM 771]|jgi:cysteine synthase A|uniref:Cysteine synthase n=1 Tax=Desulfofarcimen acetoxidans (strain ATCC 49208 / DSM 771 / KCTC 5769 / VKM B-1644 / 5575) TaxID=485916 RepID=C8W266_DESAS|nr:cysteine synthase A [Desulfofarcimen acetoxidans]ACV61730.1 cysteine synthase A [Desulfofarcimen acetoxidans DSM 771]